MVGDLVIDDFIGKVSSKKQADLIVNIHMAIDTTLPQYSLDLKWDVPFYKYIKNLCYVNEYRDHVYIGFMDGKKLREMGLQVDMTDTSMIGKYYIQEYNSEVESQFLQILLAAVTLQERWYGNKTK